MGWTKGVRFPAGAGIFFSSLLCLDRFWDPTQPPIERVPGNLSRGKAAGA
jgi:hypothetical protein